MIIYLIGMVGIAAFSITGVVAAGKKDMDLFCTLLHLAPEAPFNRYGGLALAFGLRCASIHWGLYYPRFLLYKGKA
ncbi:hypothetical protein [Desulfoluna sp.]|uniref:hypothetical protein n=1 Tax=Desulfoluna sp. TaxID=2045199 RepID=UPI0026164755|nr:hypothetical protein [Desulfoluna sp.]